MELLSNQQRGGDQRDQNSVQHRFLVSITLQNSAVSMSQNPTRLGVNKKERGNVPPAGRTDDIHACGACEDLAVAAMPVGGCKRRGRGRRGGDSGRMCT